MKALVDPITAKAYRLLNVERQIINALAPLPQVKRLRVLEALCVLHGMDELVERIHKARQKWERSGGDEAGG